MLKQWLKASAKCPKILCQCMKITVHITLDLKLLSGLGHANPVSPGNYQWVPNHLQGDYNTQRKSAHHWFAIIPFMLYWDLFTHHARANWSFIVWKKEWGEKRERGVDSLRNTDYNQAHWKWKISLGRMLMEAKPPRQFLCKLSAPQSRSWAGPIKRSERRGRSKQRRWNSMRKESQGGSRLDFESIKFGRGSGRISEESEKADRGIHNRHIRSHEGEEKERRTLKD